MMTLLHDLRYSLRTLLRQPFFTLVATLVLGLGIGANTAVFNVVNTVLLRPLTYPESDRLVFIRECNATLPSGSVSYPNYLDWRAEQKSFTDLALVRRSSFNLSFPRAAGVEPERVTGAEISGNYLVLLGIPPLLGRTFTEAEDTPGGPKAVILSEGFWRRRLAADRNAVGQSIVVDGVTREIVGVLPATVRSPRQSEVYVPLGDLRKEKNVLERGNHPGFSAVGRLKPGVTLTAARQDIQAIARGLERRYPDSNTGRSITAERMIDASVGDYRRNLYMLLGAVGCVLLIACANVANLQLARATGRTKELAVRAALGASRARLVRQLLTESAMLGLCGGVAGVLLALWATDAIISLAPKDVPRFEDLRVDWASLTFAAVVAVGSGVLVGVWPAWSVTRTAALSRALHQGNARGGSAGSAQGRARAWLVVAQLALTVVLLAGAGLTLKSFHQARSISYGFRRDGVLTMSLALPETRYNKEQTAVFFEQLLDRMRALPGVMAAASAENIPFDGDDWDSDFHIVGTPPEQPGKEPSAEVTLATADYFKVMGMPLVRGRTFGPEERTGRANAVIIDELFASRYFPGQDPIGRQLDNMMSNDKDAPAMTIVGIAPRTRNGPPGDSKYLENLPQVYVPVGQTYTSRRMLLVRVASGDPMQLAEPVRRAVLSLDRDLPVASVATMEGNIAAEFSSQRLTLVLLASFAVLALVLASLGLYGVMALGVAQRTRELGIRLALGAQRAAVLWLVLGQSARLVGIGLALGLVAALGVGRVLSSIVYGVSTADVQILLLVALVLGGVGLVASYLPARRATRINPLSALREE